MSRTGSGPLHGCNGPPFLTLDALPQRPGIASARRSDAVVPTKPQERPATAPAKALLKYNGTETSLQRKPRRVGDSCRKNA